MKGPGFFPSKSASKPIPISQSPSREGASTAPEYPTLWKDAAKQGEQVSDDTQAPSREGFTRALPEDAVFEMDFV